MNQSGKVHKVNMAVTSNLRAYLEDTKYDDKGIARVDREGDDNTGIATGSANQDMKVKPGKNHADEAFKSYRINTLID